MKLKVVEVIDDLFGRVVVVVGHNLIEVLEHALEVAKNGTIAQDL